MARKCILTLWLTTLCPVAHTICSSQWLCLWLCPALVNIDSQNPPLSVWGRLRATERYQPIPDGFHNVGLRGWALKRRLISFVEYDKPCTRAQLSRHTKEAQKTYFFFPFFFVTISFCFGSLKDKMCAFMNLKFLLFLSLLLLFSPRFWPLFIIAYLVNCLYDLMSVCVACKQFKNPNPTVSSWRYDLWLQVWRGTEFQNQKSLRFCLLIRNENSCFQHSQLNQTWYKFGGLKQENVHTTAFIFAFNLT